MGRISGVFAGFSLVATVLAGCGEDSTSTQPGGGGGGTDAAITTDAATGNGDTVQSTDGGERSGGDVGSVDTASATDTGSGRQGCAGGCDDNNDCTDDSCVAKQCVHSFNSKPCDDGVACTGADACKDGKCQGKSIYWQKTYGGPDEDVGNDAVPVEDGLAVAGFTKSFGAGGRDAWLVRIDAQGDKVWEKTWGVALDQYAMAVGRSDKTLYVVGAWHEQVKGRPRGWLQAIGYDGNEKASHLMPIEAISELNGVSVGAASSKPTLRMHVAGHREDKDGNIAMAVARINPETMQPEWVKHFGKTGFDAAWDVAQLYSGEVAVVGDTAPGGSGPHVLLQLLDPTGTPKWSKTYHSNGEDTGWAVMGHPDPVAQNKGFTVAGSRKAPGEKVTAAWIMRAGPDGGETFQVEIKAAGGATAYDIAAGYSGGYVVAGRTAKAVGQDKAALWMLDKAGVVQHVVEAGEAGASAKGVVRWTSAHGAVGQSAQGKAADLLVIRASKSGKTSCP